MKKTYLLFLLSFVYLVVPEASATYLNMCEDQNPTCCLPPAAVQNGGGCPAGEVWIGGPLYGRCAVPVACAAPGRFNCATNACDMGGNFCNTTSITTDICCAAGQVPIKDALSNTGWTCGNPGGTSPWLEDAFGPYVLNKTVGIGQNTAASSYSLAVRADGNNAATAGGITADSILANSVGISATGARAGGIFTGLGGAALQGLSGGAIEALSDSNKFAATVVGYLQAVTFPTSQVQLGSSSNHNVSLRRNSVSFIDIINTGTRPYVRFPQGTEAAPNLAESGSVIVGNPTGAHLVLDPNEVLAKSNGTTATTLYLNDGANTIISPNGGNVVVSPTVSSATNLCIDGFNRIANCSSSLRYKEKVRPLSSLLRQNALDLVRSLRPVAFDWIEGEENDFGLIAEEVEKVFPEGIIYKEGQVQGVKYDQFTALLIAGMQEQQEQIEAQQKQIEELKTLLCLDRAEGC